MRHTLVISYTTENETSVPTELEELLAADVIEEVRALLSARERPARLGHFHLETAYEPAQPR